jgi:hypothetical protein
MNDKIWETLFWNTSGYIKTSEVEDNKRQNNMDTPN